MSDRRSSTRRKSVTVWCLENARGRLEMDPYPIGRRDRMMADWWPTRSEALAASAHYKLPVHPVKVKFSFTRH